MNVTNMSLPDLSEMVTVKEKRYFSDCNFYKTFLKFEDVVFWKCPKVRWRLQYTQGGPLGRPLIQVAYEFDDEFIELCGRFFVKADPSHFFLKSKYSFWH